MSKSFESSGATEKSSELPQDVQPAISSDDRLAARLRGFGPIGIVAILIVLAGNFVFPPLSAVLALVWTRLSRTPWRDIGYIRPRSWIGSAIFGIAFGVVFKFVMKALVMPPLGAPPINPAYHYLAGNTAALPGMLFTLIVVAGWGEETLFRGYMFERLGKLFGKGAVAKIATVLFTSAVFALAHYSVQGLPGVEQAMITGLVFGMIFAITGRIFVIMIAHAAYDVTALAMIYWEFESAVAHLIFK